MPNDIAILLIAFLAAANCGLIGCFLVVRRQAMLADAISHAVLPGIVGAFIATHTIGMLPLLAGAIIAGILSMLFVEFLRDYIKVPQDAAIGVSSTFFFALGLILLARYASDVDLDLGCVLYGELLGLNFDRCICLGVDIGPKAIYILGGLLCINLLCISSFYPVLLVISFDEDFAKVTGYRTRWWNYGFLVVIAANIVLILKMVGAPLVVGFIAIPATTAYLFSRQLPSMLGYTLVIAAIITINGYYVARAFSSSVQGSIIFVGGILFFALFLLSHPVVQRKRVDKKKGKD